MKSLHQNMLLMFLITTLGLWGCSQSGSDTRSAAAKIRQLENRNTRLEEDYKAGLADLNATRKKLTGAETQLEELTKQNQTLQNLLKERDELQQKLAASQGERDALRVQLTSFSKELQSLTTRVQHVVGSPGGGGEFLNVSQQK